MEQRIQQPTRPLIAQRRIAYGAPLDDKMGAHWPVVAIK